MPSNRSVERFKALMKAIPERVKAAAAKEVKKQADELAAAIRAAAPEETGRLKASVRVEPGKGPINFKVKAGGKLTTKRVRKDPKGRAPLYDYAVATEFGTARHLQRGVTGPDPSVSLKSRAGRKYLKQHGSYHPGTAHPFFWPTYRKKRRGIRAAIKKAIIAEINKPGGS